LSRAKEIWDVPASSPPERIPLALELLSLSLTPGSNASSYEDLGWAWAGKGDREDRQCLIFK